jgi:hypothetical protein
MRPLVFLLLAAGLTGCGSKVPEVPPVNPPAQYDPDGMTDGAFKLYDKNKDGSIDGSEFTACPALKRLKGGRAVTRADLKARFEMYAAAGAESVVPTTMNLTQDGNPIHGVLCTLTPEPFMGPGFKPATCMIDDSGFGEFKVEGSTGVGVPAGLYKLTLSRKTAGGMETLPAAFNTASKDVREVAYDGRTGTYAMEVDLPPQ